MKCSCGHKVEEHKFNADLESYDECLRCDCEGFDLGASGPTELYLGVE